MIKSRLIVALTAMYIVINLFAASARASTLSVDTNISLLGIQAGQQVSLGQNFQIQIYVTDITDLAAIELELSWDDSILALQDVTQQDFFPSPWYSTGDWELTTDTTTPGLLGASMVNTVDDTATESGSGRLFSVTFTAIGTGTTDLLLSNVSYSGGNPVTSPLYFDTLENGLIGVDVAVPIPAAIWLFGSGLLALTALSRRKQFV